MIHILKHNLPRRSGKTRFLIDLATQENKRSLFVSPMLKGIILPELLNESYAEFHASENAVYSNDWVVRLVTPNTFHPDKFKGYRFDHVLVDEAGMWLFTPKDYRIFEEIKQTAVYAKANFISLSS